MADQMWAVSERNELVKEEMFGFLAWGSWIDNGAISEMKRTGRGAGVQVQLGYTAVGFWREIWTTHTLGHPGREGHWCQLPTAPVLLLTRDGRGKL